MSKRCYDRQKICRSRFPQLLRFVSEKNRRLGLAFAKEHPSGTFSDWSKVIWSDESPYVLRCTQKRRVWRLKNERYRPFALQGTVKQDKKIVVWGCFAAHRVGGLVRIEGIADAKLYVKILCKDLTEIIQKLFPGEEFIFQRDNDPKHTAKITKALMRDEMGPVQLPRPSQSPDLDPIENLWAILDRSICNRSPSGRVDLETVNAGTGRMQKVIRRGRGARFRDFRSDSANESTHGKWAPFFSRRGPFAGF